MFRSRLDRQSAPDRDQEKQSAGPDGDQAPDAGAARDNAVVTGLRAWRQRVTPGWHSWAK